MKGGKSSQWTTTPRGSLPYLIDPHEIVSFVEDAIANPAENRRLVLAETSEACALDVQRVAELDVRGFQFVLDQSDARHVLRSHGDEAYEAQRGLRAITAIDFGDLPLVLAAPDSIELAGMTKTELKVLRFEKLLEGRRSVALSVRVGRKHLAILSMWETKQKH